MLHIKANEQLMLLEAPSRSRLSNPWAAIFPRGNLCSTPHNGARKQERPHAANAARRYSSGRVGGAPCSQTAARSTGRWPPMSARTPPMLRALPAPSLT